MTVVETAAGERVRIRLADIVAGKPVPPRPTVRTRVDAAEVERRGLADWPPLVREPLGEWVLRASGGFSARGNSALVAGDPGLPWDAALARVRSFYAGHDLPAWGQVVVGSAEDVALEDAGWATARSGEADTAVLLGAVAGVSRALRRDRPSAPPGAGLRWELTDSLPQSWLAHDERARAYGDVARRVLEGAAQVGFLTAYDQDGPDEAVGFGRVSTDGEWASLTNLWVAPGWRRRGLARQVVAGLVPWAAERGARTASLSVLADNVAALALYERLGFVEHHRRRYLATP